MGYDWNFAPVLRHFDLLMYGLGNTLMVTAIAFVIGLPIGFAFAMARLSKWRALAMPAGFVIDFFRCTPSLVQLFWFFFAFPMLTGIRLSPFSAVVITLTILSAAFTSEIFRAGILSLERGQWEAARALGMRHRQMMKRIILPQAVKRMIPVFLERAIELLKTSTIASTISYTDILFNAQEISHQTYRPMEVFTTVAVIFLIIVTTGSQLTRWVERWMARSGESTVH